MTVLGLFLLILGGKHYKVTMFLAGQMSACAFLMVILFVSVYPSNSPYWVVWLSLVLTLGAGSGVGYVTQRWARLGVLLIGAWIGGLIGGVLYGLVFHAFAHENPLLCLWLCIVFCSVILAVLSMVFFDHAVIIGAAIGGSYLFIRGISCFAGGYPNEFLLYHTY